MMFPLFRRRRSEANVAALYGAIVAQARLPAFYADYGVADTLEGRFDMVVLHLSLVLRRLRGGCAPQQALAQQVFDAFCTDMDHNLREMGVSDVGVPRRMRRFGEAFYGRAAAYDRALDANDDGGLCMALGRNIFGREDAADARATRLAAYVRALEGALAAQDADAIAAGRIALADPAAW